MADPVWELRITRLGLQKLASEDPPVRTYGAYQVFIDDQQIANLAGIDQFLHTADGGGVKERMVHHENFAHTLSQLNQVLHLARTLR